MVTQRHIASSSSSKGKAPEGQDLTTSLPYAIDASMSLSPDELRVLQDQYVEEEDKGFVSTQTKFNLAWGLTRSDRDQYVKEGISLLMDIYEHEPLRRRECLYYLSLGHYKLKNYSESKRYLTKLLDKEPGNMQALSLSGMIDRDVKNEGLLGMAIAGGALTVIGAVAIAAFAKARR